jgi:plastocyanin
MHSPAAANLAVQVMGLLDNLREARNFMPEPTIAKVTITPAPEGITIFNPSTQTINLNDSVFWGNNTSEAHWPAPDGGQDNQWLTQPIPAHGESPQVVFDSTPTGKTASFPYHCAKHPYSASEKGVITVTVAS